MDAFIGRQLGDFVIRERIGRGGTATVYLAHQRSVDRDVALKVMVLDESDRVSVDFRRRFDSEAKLIAGLEHIHILPVYEYGIVDDVACLAMRLLRGGTLGDLLRNGPLQTDAAVELFEQFASALAYAHRNGVIHRDLKPSNIMLDDSGNVLLTDFGLAKLVGHSLELTQAGTVIGTPAYMSPEQLRGQPLDARSDIYSAGVVLYQMLTGRSPFGAPRNDLIATIHQQLEDPPTPPRSIQASITPQVEAVVLRALAKDPADRFDTVESMAAALAQAVGRETSSGRARTRFGDSRQALARATKQRTGRAAIPAKRRQLSLLALAAGAMLVLALLAWRLLPRSGHGERRAAAHASTVHLGQQAPAAQAEPTAAEVTRAQERLGANGFIAYITCTQSTEYHATQAREMGDIAAQFQLRYRVYDCDADEYRQLTQIERARADGATGLVVCPLDADLLATPLAAVERAGLPLVILQSGMPSYGGVLIAGDDYEMGLKAGRFAGDIVATEMGAKATVIVLGFPELPSLVRRSEGLEHGLLERAPKARIVGRFKGGTREFGAASVGDLIASGGTFDVILSINDAGSFGAIAAMEKRGIDPSSVIISSVDAEALAREYLRKGYFLRGSVATDRVLFSRTAINAMVKVLAGSTLPETFVVPPGEVVTRESLQQTDGTGG
jgi:ABC-type sugar transport system substrate-binding protein/tRNA A-37 threonylcarbamoyl transferase component Bud32